MTRLLICNSLFALLVCACVTDADLEGEQSSSTVAQAGVVAQGMTLQGMTLQGMTLQGMTLQGMRLHGATLSGTALIRMRVERGELVAERGSTTLRGAALAGVELTAVAQRSIRGGDRATAMLSYRIAAVAPEYPRYDPTHTGNTWLYTLEQRDDDTGAWRPACPVDADGDAAAIPLAAVWDERGDRHESASQFTFACTTGVIAKCYRWGYRPWLTGYGDIADAHWTCTRLARADYCGNGVPHTREATPINLWDELPGRGPIQRHGLLPRLGMVFEAGWSTRGAVCLSRARWLLDDGLAIAALCPDRLIPPGLGGTVCNTLGEVFDYGDAVLFNESYLLQLGL